MSSAAERSGRPARLEDAVIPGLEASLWERLLSAENLGRAPWRVRANGGAPGADGMTTEELVPWLREHWAATRQDQLATLLPMSERVLGPEHPDTVITRNQLARWTGQPGDAAPDVS